MRVVSSIVVLCLAIASGLAWSFRSASEPEPFYKPRFWDGRIYRGDDAKEGEFPFMVRVYFSNMQCGGSFIRKNVVITAAHCAVKENGKHFEPKDFTLHVGDHKTSQWDTNEQTLKVSKVIVHEGYGKTKGSLEHDIALLVVAGTYEDKNGSTGTINLPPVAMKSELYKDDGPITIIGWGGTEKADGAEILQKLTYNIAPKSKCRQFWGNNLFDGNLCTYIAGKKLTQHSWGGDSGGPLFTKKNDKNYLLALVSFGVNEPNDQAYDVNTDVSAYLGWIEEKIGKDDNKEKEDDKEKEKEDDKDKEKEDDKEKEKEDDKEKEKEDDKEKEKEDDKEKEKEDDKEKEKEDDKEKEKEDDKEKEKEDDKEKEKEDDKEKEKEDDKEKEKEDDKEKEKEDDKEKEKEDDKEKEKEDDKEKEKEDDKEKEKEDDKEKEKEEDKDHKLDPEKFKLELVGGSGKHEGIIFVKHPDMKEQNVGHTICNDKFSHQSAMAVCHHLGYKFGKFRGPYSYLDRNVEDNSKFSFANFHCKDNAEKPAEKTSSAENLFRDCKMEKYMASGVPCFNGDQAAVSCSNEVFEHKVEASHRVRFMGNGKQMRVRSVVKMEAKKFGQPVWMADAIKPVLVNVKSDGKVEMIADRMFFKKRRRAFVRTIKKTINFKSVDEAKKNTCLAGIIKLRHSDGVFEMKIDPKCGVGAEKAKAAIEQWAKEMHKKE